jgi:hypothetical protein
MFRIIYKTERGTVSTFHTIAESFNEAIQNFQETTGLNELNIQSIQFLD